ncbi:antibiotic biosynthesis monooxygenase [Streptomyces griseoincarnatus]
MSRHVETPPEVGRTDAGLAVITVRYAGDEQRLLADGAVTERENEAWPDGLLSWSLFSSTDGASLMAYEQWTGDEALDRALAGSAPYLPGISSTEPAVPVRYRLHRSHVTTADRTGVAVGCVVTPVFEAEGPERQRHFVDEVFSMTKDVAPMPGSIAAHFHLSTDGTRVFNYAEWTDEQAHLDAVTAPRGEHVRRRVSGDIPGVRPCGYQRWHLHSALVAE